MPSDRGYGTRGKRKADAESDSIQVRANHPTQRRKRAHTGRHETPSWFWDNLSRQWLTPHSLREFDRRASPLVPPERPQTTALRVPQLAGLRRFARQGGPDLKELRSYPKPISSPPTCKTMSSSQSSLGKRSRSSNTSITKGSRRSSAYSRGFEQHLADHGVLMTDRNEKPGNYEDILEKLQNPRPSLSPSRFSLVDFEAFQAQNEEAKTEMTVMNQAFPIIAGTRAIPSEQNLLFNNLAPLTDGSVTDAQPDIYDGSRPSDLNPSVRKALGPSLMPSKDASVPCAPNFFAEGKGPGGHTAVAKRQACYDGALGTRGMESLRTFGNPDAALDGYARTITSTYSGGAGGGFLTFYATHAHASMNPSLGREYRMTQLDSYAMTGNIKTFRQGATAFRNARDWAKEQRESLIASANEMALHTASSASETPATTSQSTVHESEDSDTSPDELTFGSSALISFASDMPPRSTNRQSQARPNQDHRATRRSRKVLKKSGTASGES